MPRNSLRLTQAKFTALAQNGAKREKRGVCALHDVDLVYNYSRGTLA